jgi:hypothetical protein
MYVAVAVYCCVGLAGGGVKPGDAKVDVVGVIVRPTTF